MRKIIISIIPAIIVITGFIYGLIWFAHYKTSFPIPESRSNADFSAVITRAQPQMATKSGQPIFTIVSTKRVSPHWYLVGFRQRNAPSTSLVSEVVINDPYYDSNRMNLIARPESQFSAADLEQDQIPQSVIKGIIK